MDGCARTIEWLRTRIPVPVIRQICEADYGRDVEAHFAGVMSLLAGGWTNGVPPWCPREVLELERWSECDHLRRMFACALLVACMGYERKDRFFLESGIETLWRLGDSAIALGGDAPGLALEMLEWFLTRDSGPRVHPYACFCVARLRRHLGIGDTREMKAWLDSEEAEARGRLGTGGRWLAGLSEHANTREYRHHWVWE